MSWRTSLLDHRVHDRRAPRRSRPRPARCSPRRGSRRGSAARRRVSADRSQGASASVKRFGRLVEPSTSTSSKSRATRPRAGCQRTRATCCIAVCRRPLTITVHRPALVVDGAALAGVVGCGSRRRRSSRGRRCPASPGRRGRTACRSDGANQSRPSQRFIAARASSSLSRNGSCACGLICRCDAGVGDDRRGAERAFLGVQVGVELDLRAAARALRDPDLLHLRRPAARRARPRAGRARGSAPRALRDRLLVAAVLALQPVDVRARSAGPTPQAGQGKRCVLQARPRRRPGRAASARLSRPAAAAAR